MAMIVPLSHARFRATGWTVGALRRCATAKCTLPPLRQAKRSVQLALRMRRLTNPLEGVSVRRRTIGIAGSCLALAVGVSACGSSNNNSSGGGSGGGTVDFYSSLPLQGASKDQTAAMVNGMKLALSQA